MCQAADLPNDVEALKGILIERDAVLAERSTALETAQALVIAQKLELEKLRFEIACLKRMKFGRSSRAARSSDHPDGLPRDPRA